MIANISTTIEIFDNLSYPLDNSHVRWFDSLTSQTTFFDNRSKAQTLHNQKYLRVDDYDFELTIRGNVRDSQKWGYARIKNLYESNDKWYYVFITKVKYVDDSSVKLFMSIDFFQTYLFEMRFLQSFVERQHQPLYQSSGLPFLNTIDEGLDYGKEYQVVSTYPLKKQNYFYLVIISSKVIGEYIGIPNLNYVGIPTSVYTYIIPYQFSTSHTSDNGIKIQGSQLLYTPTLSQLLNTLKSDEDIVNSILSLYVTTYTGIQIGDCINNGILDLKNNASEGQKLNGLYANTFKVKNVEDDMYILYVNDRRFFEDSIISNVNKYNNVPNYKESKLKLYPYTIATITDLKGNQIDLKPELITGLYLTSYIRGSLGTQNKVGYYISNYNGSNPESQTIMIDESPNNIPILVESSADYIQGNGNSINTKIALSKKERNIDMASSLVQALPMFVRPDTAMSGVANLTTGLMQAENRHYSDVKMLQAKKQDVDNIPPNVSSLGGNSTYEWGNKLDSPILQIKTVTPEYANKLTDYFHMYGYQVNELLNPNFHTRTHFNYLKCTSLNIQSGYNRDIILRFKAIFENGVTLWHTDDIMNYNVTNGVI